MSNTSQTVRIVPEITVNTSAAPRTHIVIYQEEPSLSNKVEPELHAVVAQLTERIAALEAQVLKPRTPFFPPAVAPEPTGIEVVRKTDMTVPDIPQPDTKTLFQTLIQSRMPPMDLAHEEQEQEQEEAEEVEVEVEEEQEEEQAEEEVEDDAIALIPFEYDDVTYYRDDDKNVYQLDEDEDIDDVPVGVWKEDEQKPLFKIEYKDKVFYRDNDTKQVFEVDESNTIGDSPYGIWNEEKQKVLRYSKA